jgi:hypothetical protein
MHFANAMFMGCHGAAFTMNSDFNLPSGITTADGRFANSMFFRAGGPSFQINSVFVFPTLDDSLINNADNNLSYVFTDLVASTPAQLRTIASILGGNG